MEAFRKLFMHIAYTKITILHTKGTDATESWRLGLNTSLVTSAESLVWAERELESNLQGWLFHFCANLHLFDCSYPPLRPPLNLMLLLELLSNGNLRRVTETEF